MLKETQGEEKKGRVRWSACLPCRKKRMKCSSERPSCSQCLRARYNEKCVYEEKPVPNTTLALNKRIRELEDEITLLETVPPHAKSKPSTAPKIPKSLPVPRSLHSASMSLNFTEALRRTKVPDLPADWVDGEPPEHVRQRLIRTFVLYRHHLAYECHIPRLLAALDKPPTHPDALHPCLVNAIYLAGSHFGRLRHGEHDNIEGIFLKRLRKGLEDSLSMCDRLFHFVLASTMLARWYMCSGRIIEAYNQSSTIAHFATSCRLNKISSPWLSDAPKSILGFPRDSIELGERINAFWSIVAIDRASSLAGGFPNTIKDYSITTMWPLPIDQFEDGRAVNMQYGTITTLLLPGDPFLTVNKYDLYMLPAKTTLLLDHAARMATRAREQRASTFSAFRSNEPPVGPEEIAVLETALHTVAAKLQQLTESSTLPTYPSIAEYSSLDNEVPTADITCNRLMCREAVSFYAMTLVHGALMELYSINAPYTTLVYIKMVTSAHAIARIAAEAADIKSIPFAVTVGLTWTVACDVLIAHTKIPQPSPCEFDDPALTRRSINSILNGLREISSFNPLFVHPEQRITGLVDKLPPL